MSGVKSNKIIVLFCILSFFSLESCIFGKAQSRGVMSYRHERVYLQYGGSYEVGALPDGWERLNVKARAITFYSDDFKASITTDAFCGRSFVDRPLDTLAGELISVLSNRTTVTTEKFMLDGRGAERFFVVGKMDGVPLHMDVVVVKKNNCNFDFVAVAPPDASDEVREDFEQFFTGFHY